jgi:hypothetical protein
VIAGEKNYPRLKRMNMMKKTMICLICILADLILVLPAANAQGNLNANQTIQNAQKIVTLNDTQITTQNAIEDATKSHKVLRLGFERTKPLNNLDVYGSKTTYDIEARGRNSSFNVSQRLGNISNITDSTNIYKPFFEVNEYIRVKPTYEAPSNLGTRPVYNITGYPVIKTPSSIP